MHQIRYIYWGFKIAFTDHEINFASEIARFQRSNKKNISEVQKWIFLHSNSTMHLVAITVYWYWCKKAKSWLWTLNNARLSVEPVSTCDTRDPIDAQTVNMHYLLPLFVFLLAESKSAFPIKNFVVLMQENRAFGVWYEFDINSLFDVFSRPRPFPRSSEEDQPEHQRAGWHWNESLQSLRSEFEEGASELQFRTDWPERMPWSTLYVTDSMIDNLWIE
jgi:hypothetical protein